MVAGPGRGSGPSAELFEAPAPKRKTNRAEQRLHIACVDYLRRCVPDRGLFWFHPYNGGWRTPREAALGRALGVRAGVPDLMLVWQGQVAGVEFKRPKGPGVAAGRLSAEQLQVRHELLAAGAVLCAEVSSLEAFVVVLRTLGVPVRGVVAA